MRYECIVLLYSTGLNSIHHIKQYLYIPDSISEFLSASCLCQIVITSLLDLSTTFDLIYCTLTLITSLFWTPRFVLFNGRAPFNCLQGTRIRSVLFFSSVTTFISD